MPASPDESPHLGVMRYVTLALLWLVATALAGGVTWAAVAWSERQPVGGVDLQRPLTDAEVRRNLSSLAAPQPTTSRAPTRHSSTRGREVPNAGAPAPVVQTRSWQTAGGSVAARCRADHIELLYAAPANGWVYHLGPGTSTSLTVRFTGPRAVSTLLARCAGHAPIAVSATSPRPTSPHDSESGD